MIALGGQANVAIPPGAARAFVVAARQSRAVAAAQAESRAELLLAPCFSRSDELPKKLKPGYEPSVVILGSMQTEATGLALALAKSWRMRATVVVPIGEAPSEREGVVSIGAAEYVDSLVRGEASAPWFAVDLSLGRPGLSLAREILERLRVMVVGAEATAVHPSLGRSAYPAVVGTEFELFEVFRAFASNAGAASDALWARTQTNTDSDRGWAFIHHFCERLFAGPAAALA
jgi:hypothetical protein